MRTDETSLFVRYLGKYFLCFFVQVNLCVMCLCATSIFLEYAGRLGVFNRNNSTTFGLLEVIFIKGHWVRYVIRASTQSHVF